MFVYLQHILDKFAYSVRRNFTKIISIHDTPGSSATDFVGVAIIRYIQYLKLYNDSNHVDIRTSEVADHSSFNY